MKSLTIDNSCIQEYQLLYIDWKKKENNPGIVNR